MKTFVLIRFSFLSFARSLVRSMENPLSSLCFQRQQQHNETSEKETWEKSKYGMIIKWRQIFYEHFYGFFWWTFLLWILITGDHQLKLVTSTENYSPERKNFLGFVLFTLSAILSSSFYLIQPLSHPKHFHQTTILVNYLNLKWNNKTFYSPEVEAHVVVEYHRWPFVVDRSCYYQLHSSHRLLEAVAYQAVLMIHLLLLLMFFMFAKQPRMMMCSVKEKANSVRENWGSEIDLLSYGDKQHHGIIKKFFHLFRWFDKILNSNVYKRWGERAGSFL